MSTARNDLGPLLVHRRETNRRDGKRGAQLFTVLKGLAKTNPNFMSSLSNHRTENFRIIGILYAPLRKFIFP